MTNTICRSVGRVIPEPEIKSVPSLRCVLCTDYRRSCGVRNLDETRRCVRMYQLNKVHNGRTHPFGILY